MLGNSDGFVIEKACSGRMKSWHSWLEQYTRIGGLPLDLLLFEFLDDFCRQIQSNFLRIRWDIITASMWVLRLIGNGGNEHDFKAASTALVATGKLGNLEENKHGQANNTFALVNTDNWSGGSPI